jgi:hypothetical protein
VQPLARPCANRAVLEALADKGDAVGVWSAWNRLAASRETLRLGVDLATRLGDIPRGLDLYARLRSESTDVERATLRLLTLGAASKLASAADLDARVIACSAALRLDPTHRACRTALETMADRGASGGEILLGAYALVEAGLRGVPLFPAEVERLLTPSFRLHLARQGRDLPATERLALVRPVLTHQDQAYRYQAILLAGTIEDPSILAALQPLEAASTPIRVAKMVSLAALGHAESVEAARAIYDGLDDSSKILAGLALARVNDARGSNVLDQSLRSSNELTRNFAAEIVVRLNPGAVVTPILEAVGSGSAVGRAGALRVAGLVALGTEPDVYRQLGDTDVLVSAEAVAAVARTLVRPPATTGPQP